MKEDQDNSPACAWAQLAGFKKTSGEKSNTDSRERSINKIKDAEDELGSDLEVTPVQVNNGDENLHELEKHTHTENVMIPLRRSERIRKMIEEGMLILQKQSLVFSSYYDTIHEDDYVLQDDVNDP